MKIHETPSKRIPRSIPPKAHDEVWKLHLEGLTSPQIALRLSCSASRHAVRRLVTQLERAHAREAHSEAIAEELKLDRSTARALRQHYEETWNDICDDLAIAARKNDHERVLSLSRAGRIVARSTAYYDRAYQIALKHEARLPKPDPRPAIPDGAPTITSPVEGARIPNAMFYPNGTGVPSSAVDMTIDDIPLPPEECTPNNGQWFAPPFSLKPGDHTFAVRYLDAPPSAPRSIVNFTIIGCVLFLFLSNLSCRAASKPDLPVKTFLEPARSRSTESESSIDCDASSCVRERRRPHVAPIQTRSCPVITLAACRDAQSPPTAAFQSSPTPSSASPAQRVLAAPPPAAPPASAAYGGSRRSTPAGTQASEPLSDYRRKVVRDLDLTLEITSLDRFLRDVQRIADSSGGYLAEADVPQRNGGVTPSGTVMLRVPSEALDGVSESFETLGQIESRTLRSQDITDQFYDGAARLSNQRRYEARLLKLIETHNGRLDDLLTLEQQVASVRENIERLEGQQRLWAHQAELATIRIHFHVAQPAGAPAASPTFANRFLRTLLGSMKALRKFGETTALAFATVLPWLPLVLLVFGGRMLWRRRNTLRAGGATT